MTSPSDRPVPDASATDQTSSRLIVPKASAVGPVGRRNLLKAFGAGAVAVGAGGLLEACSGGIKGSSSGSGVQLGVRRAPRPSRSAGSTR